MPDFKGMRGALCLAPMAGITDRTFREICKNYGCDFGVTEMISANGLVRSPGESHIQQQLMEKAPGRVFVSGYARSIARIKMFSDAARANGNLSLLGTRMCADIRTAAFG